jgi:hypothetical protein
MTTRTLPTLSGNSPYRKYVARQLRNGHGKLRVYGERGNWTVGVELPHRIVPLKSGFATKPAALLYGYRKHSQKATQIKLEPALAA